MNVERVGSSNRKKERVDTAHYCMNELIPGTLSGRTLPRIIPEP